MDMLNLTGLMIVAAVALCALWGVAGRIESGRHRRVDTADAHTLAALRARWNAAVPEHSALRADRELPALPASRWAEPID
jgi:hypothetical protein